MCQYPSRWLGWLQPSIACVPLFTNLCQFPEGYKFKQWTGDDSKALIKVMIYSLHLPFNVVTNFKHIGVLTGNQRTCAKGNGSGHMHIYWVFYIAWCDVLDIASLQALDNALTWFHEYWTIFQECGVRSDGFSLPHQHVMVYYHKLIQDFGAPNGLCSSITESKHHFAVKKPWQWGYMY